MELPRLTAHYRLLSEVAMGFLIFLAAVFAVLLIVIANGYDRLATLRNRYKNAYSQVDDQLRQRYDLIPDFIEAVRSQLAQEDETPQRVQAACQTAAACSHQAAQTPGQPEAMQALASAEANLDDCLQQLLSRVRTGSLLRTNPTAAPLLAELDAIVSRFTFACQTFNDTVHLYNQRRRQFPGSLVAALFSFQLAVELPIPSASPQMAPSLYRS